MLTLERTGGTRITYDVNGDGPAIVLTHSFLFDHSMWRHQLPALHDEGWRVVNVDLRGHGKSTPVRRPFTIDDLADDVVAVLDAADADEGVWCGHSIGGMLSLRAAVRHPERVRALVLANTTAGLEDRIARIRYRVLARWNQLFGLRAIRSQVTPLLFGPTARRDQPELVTEWEQRWAQMDRRSARLFIHALVTRDDIRALLPSIDVPSLVLTGDGDEALLPARSQEIANTLPDAELVVIADSGHLSPLEQPDPFTGALVGFLSRLSAADSGR
jgi:3-oxoadipate enol-lactonase